jgi:hypothetical protein
MCIECSLALQRYYEMEKRLIKGTGVDRNGIGKAETGRAGSYQPSDVRTSEGYGHPSMVEGSSGSNPADSTNGS